MKVRDRNNITCQWFVNSLVRVQCSLPLTNSRIYALTMPAVRVKKAAPTYINKRTSNAGSSGRMHRERQQHPDKERARMLKRSQQNRIQRTRDAFQSLDGDEHAFLDEEPDDWMDEGDDYDGTDILQHTLKYHR